MNHKELENVFAINGHWFVYGFKKDVKIYEEPKHLSKRFYGLLKFIEDKFRDKIFLPFDKGWIYNSFMKYEGMTPSYYFQCSFIDKDSALNASKIIIEEIDNIIKNKANVVVVIAEGDIKTSNKENINKDDIYIRSGTFLESPEVWMHKWNENNRIFIIEGEYISKPIVEIKRYKDM